MKKGLLLLLCLAMLCLGGCSTQKQRYSKTYLDFFDTVIEITGYAASEAEFDANCAAVEELLTEYHQLTDIYNAYPDCSNAYYLNQQAAKAPVVVDEKLFALLSFAVDFAQETDGMCNIAMGSVLSLWHEAREAGIADPDAAYLPDDAALQEAAKHCDIADLQLDSENSTVFFADEQLQIDLGAVAKGYVAEQAATLLKERGATGYLLNFGGNIKAVGAKPDGSLWQAAIQDPQGGYLEETVSIQDEAVVTSGVYQRGYTVDGVWYHHIIHPQTLYPANELLSVSVIVPDSGLADGLSTALFNMGLEQGQAFLQQHPEYDAKVIWILVNGEQIDSD
jgi:thiamine biosynthesis lipoprotein